MPDRMKKVNELLQQEISKAIFKFTCDDFISVVEVRCSKDLSYAKVFVSVLNDKEGVVTKLNVLSHQIKNNLFKTVELRRIPKLVFVLDCVESEAEKIDKVLDNINIINK